MPNLSSVTRRQIELAVTSTGQQAVGQLQQSLGNVNAAIAAQQSRLASGQQTLDQFRAATAKLVAEQQRLSAEFEHASTFLARGAGMSSEALRRTTASAMQFAYAVDDVKYGMGALMNNIAPMLAPLGMWGAGISVAAVAAKALYDNWRPLTASLRPDLIEQTASGTEKLKDRIKELGAESYLTTKELKELGNAREELAAKEAEEKLMGGGTDKQSDIKNAVKKIQDDGKAGLIQGAANDAAMTKFLGDPIQALKDAARGGMLKDDDGKDITRIDTARIAVDGAYYARLKAKWIASALPTIRGQFVKRLAEEGDSSAVDEIEGIFRKAGKHESGPIRDVLTDLTNAQSGLPSQRELEAEGQKNARKSDKERREEAEKEREKEGQEEAGERERAANHIASVYLTKLREATEKTVASGVLANMADADVKANLVAGFARRMRAGGVNEVDIAEASRKAAEEAMTGANAKIMALGNTRAEGAAALMASADAKDKKADAKDEAAEENSPENKRLDDIARHFGGGAKDDFLESAMLDNRQRRDALSRMTPAERRAWLSEAKQQRRMEDANAKAYRSGLSPRDRRQFDFERQLNTMPVAPLSDEDMAATLADRQARAMLAGGATDADGKPINEADARAAGKRVVDRAARSVNDRVAGGVARTGSLDAATANARDAVAPKPRGRGMHSVGIGPAAGGGQADPLSSLATVAGGSLQSVMRTQGETTASVARLESDFGQLARFMDMQSQALARMSNARSGAPRGRQR